VLEYYQETGSHGLSWAIQAGNNHFSWKQHNNNFMASVKIGAQYIKRKH
jgi:hypothetical protein